jgi:hypothetical protein
VTSFVAEKESSHNLDTVEIPVQSAFIDGKEAEERAEPLTFI